MKDHSETEEMGSKNKKDMNINPKSKTQNPKSKEYLFDKPKNVKRLFRFYYTSLLMLLLVDFFIHKHAYFAWEEWPEFYAVFGFVACVALVVAAKYILRPLVKRREDYYD